MTPAEALALTPPVLPRPQTFELPSSARDWMLPEDRSWFWCPGRMCNDDELRAWDTLQEWDALTGRIVREALFGSPDHARRARRDAEAVAAVAEQLAVRLGARF